MPEFYNRQFKSYCDCLLRRIPLILFLPAIFSCQSNHEANKDHVAYVDSIRERASRMIDVGDFSKANAFFDSAYHTITEPGIGDEIRKYSFKGQNYYPKMEDYKNAIANLDSIFLILNTETRKKEYIREYSTALFQKGDWLFKLRKYNEAYQHYYSGKLIAETILDPCAVSEYTYRLGMVSFKQAKYLEAASNFKQCFEASDHCIKDFRIFAFQQELLANTSLSYSRFGMTDSAIIYSNKALIFIRNNAKRFPDRRNYIEMAKGVIYGNQADQYLARKDTASAENLLLKSFEINRKKGFDNGDAQFTLLKLGKLYVQTGQLEKAKHTASLLKASIDSIANLPVQIGLNKLNWAYHDKLGQTGEAYTYLQKYIGLKDSLEKENKKLVIADVDKEFQSIEQQYKYTLLSKDNELRKVYLYIAILFSLMAVVILSLLWQNWKTSRLNISSLTNLNHQIIFQNNQLEQTLADLKQSNMDKDHILKVVAHDLRNPIGAIANISGILLDEADLTEEHREFVDIIRKSSWHSIEMINDLLSASTSHRPSKMNRESFDVRELFRQCIEQVRFKADEKKQHIEIGIEHAISLAADKEKLWRVLSNLVVNAIKFSPVGGNITVSATQDNGTVILSVKDHGIGIPEELKSKIFDSFTEAKRYGTAGEQPFGLGLSFSKQIVEAHGGKIWFESTEDLGTTFFMAFSVKDYAPVSEINISLIP